MSRRILAAHLALTAVLFMGLCIPLGLSAARHDRTLFGLRFTSSTEAYVAEVKWRRLALDAPPLPDPGRDRPEGPADALRFYDPDANLLADTGEEIPITEEEMARAHRERVIIHPSDTNDHKMIILVPVRNASGLLGVLAVARSDDGLRQSIAHRWTTIIIGGVLAVLAALAISILLARWVGKPLQRLGRVAADLGAGDLKIRAKAIGGPSEVQELAATFDAMAGRIQSLVDSQRRFLADVSHQIRTPLTAMLLRLELLEQDVDDATAEEITRTLVEVRRVSRMVDGLLAVSRAEHAPASRQPIDLAGVAKERCLIWQPVATASGITLTCDVDGDVVLSSTPGHLEQILDNLFANAIEATSPGGRINIRSQVGRVGPTEPMATPPTPGTPGPTGVSASIPLPRTNPSTASAPVLRPDAVPNGARDPLSATSTGPGRGADGMSQFVIIDNGRGMSPERRAAAFRRFGSSSGSERADRRGSGLGLAIVHALVTADGGTIALEEADGGGLRVVLDLPTANRAGTARTESKSRELLEVVDDAPYLGRP